MRDLIKMFNGNPNTMYVTTMDLQLQWMELMKLIV